MQRQDELDSHKAKNPQMDSSCVLHSVQSATASAVQTAQVKRVCVVLGRGIKQLIGNTLIEPHCWDVLPACEGPHGPFDVLKPANDRCVSSLKNQTRHSHMYTSQRRLVYKTISVSSTNKP